MNTAQRTNAWKEPFLNIFEQQQANSDAMHVDSTQSMSALQSKLQKVTSSTAVITESHAKTPLQRMQDCRDGLAILDQRGWNRSFHQRLFHEDFLVSFVIQSVSLARHLRFSQPRRRQNPYPVQHARSRLFHELSSTF